MTFFGKLFVMVNLGLSLIMATAAFSAYSSGIDWSDNKKSGQPDGKLVAVKAEIAEVGKQLSLTYDSWRAVRDELMDREDDRQKLRPQYQRALANLKISRVQVSGIGPDLPNGGINFQPAEESPGVPLLGYDVYSDRVSSLRKENEQIRKDLLAKIQENLELTNQLVGTPDGKIKGLRQLLVEEREKNLGITSEAGIVDAMRINALVEEQLVNKRLESISASVDQLQKYLKRKHGVDAATK